MSEKIPDELLTEVLHGNVSISDFRKNAKEVVRTVHEGDIKIIMSNNKPMAVMISPIHYMRLKKQAQNSK